MWPGGSMTTFTLALLTTVLPEHVLSEGIYFFKGDETFHAHQILIMRGAVSMKRGLILLRLKADLTHIVLLPNMSLKI